MSFVIRQISDIRSGGFNTLIRKSKVSGFHVIDFILTIIFIPVALVIRFIKPLIHIRFGRLISERIGHFAFEPEMYLCEKDMNLQKKDVIDLFYCSLVVSNNYLLKMWRRKLTIVPKFIMSLDRANRILPGSSNHIVPLYSNKHYDIHGIMDKLPPHLEFSHSEELYGQEQLRLMGIPPGAEFICFFSRDSAYLDKLWGVGNSVYHNYRDSDIKNYILAANIMAGKGYYLIRMGAIVKEPLAVANPMIIDYATKNRNDFMDIFLLANCHFFLATTSGPTDLSVIFRKPIAFANVTSYYHMDSFLDQDIYITKKYYLVSENRILTFDEIIRTGVGKFFKTCTFDDAGIQLIENTPKEISELATEMDSRVKGIWQINDEDKMLHRRYDAILEKNGLGGSRQPHIATSFLRRNQGLLVE